MAPRFELPNPNVGTHLKCGLKEPVLDGRPSPAPLADPVRCCTPKQNRRAARSQRGAGIEELAVGQRGLNAPPARCCTACALPVRVPGPFLVTAFSEVGTRAGKWDENGVLEIAEGAAMKGSGDDGEWR